MTKVMLINILRLSPLWEEMPNEEKEFVAERVSQLTDRVPQKEQDEFIWRALAAFQKRLQHIHMCH